MARFGVRIVIYAEEAGQVVGHREISAATPAEPDLDALARAFAGLARRQGAVGFPPKPPDGGGSPGETTPAPPSSAAGTLPTSRRDENLPPATLFLHGRAAAIADGWARLVDELRGAGAMWDGYRGLSAEQIAAAPGVDAARQKLRLVGVYDADELVIRCGPRRCAAMITWVRNCKTPPRDPAAAVFSKLMRESRKAQERKQA